MQEIRDSCPCLQIRLTADLISLNLHEKQLQIATGLNRAHVRLLLIGRKKRVQPTSDLRLSKLQLIGDDRQLPSVEAYLPVWIQSTF